MRHYIATVPAWALFGLIFSSVALGARFQPPVAIKAARNSTGAANATNATTAARPPLPGVARNSTGAANATTAAKPPLPGIARPADVVEETPVTDEAQGKAVAEVPMHVPTPVSTSDEISVWATHTTTTATTTLEPEKVVLSFSVAGLTLEYLNANPELKENIRSNMQSTVATLAGVPTENVEIVFVGSSSLAAITHGKTRGETAVTASITAPSTPAQGSGAEVPMDIGSINNKLASAKLADEIAKTVTETPGIEAVVDDLSKVGVKDVQTVVVTTTKTSTTMTVTHPDDNQDHTDVSSYGDPHSKNINGQRFDIRRPGNHSFLVLPRGANQGRAKLYVEARVTRRGGLCTGKLFITGLKLAGRWVRTLGGDVELYAATEMFNSPKVVGLKLGNSSNISLAEFVARIPKQKLAVHQSRPEMPTKLNTHVNTLMLQFKVGPSTVKVGWAHEKLKDGFANWLWMGVSGLGTTDAVGGLLGSDDHSAVQIVPKDELAACQAHPGPEEPAPAAGLVGKHRVFRSWASADA